MVVQPTVGHFGFLRLLQTCDKTIGDETKNNLCFYHDSVGLGEDGPTHQPVEHLASLRAIH